MAGRDFEDFVVVVTGAPSSAVILEVAQKVLEILRQPYEIEGQSLRADGQPGLLFLDLLR